MDVGPIARSERKISYGRADREFRCSRAVRDRLDMMRAIWGRISGKNRENDKPARSLCEIAYGVSDRKIGPCLPSAARFPALIIPQSARFVNRQNKQKNPPRFVEDFCHFLGADRVSLNFLPL